MGFFVAGDFGQTCVGGGWEACCGEIDRAEFSETFAVERCFEVFESESILEDVDWRDGLVVIISALEGAIVHTVRERCQCLPLRQRLRQSPRRGDKAEDCGVSGDTHDYEMLGLANSVVTGRAMSRCTIWMVMQEDCNACIRHGVMQTAYQVKW